MRLPRAPGFDRTPSFLRNPYTFISNMCERLGTDVFETRLFFRRAICMRGEEAAEYFYDEARFARAGAHAGGLVPACLDRGNALDLDRGGHHARKALLFPLLGMRGLVRARRCFAEEWAEAMPWWEVQGKIVLHDEVEALLVRVACSWAGIPLAEIDVGRRTRDLAALTTPWNGLPSLEAWRARKRVDAWLLGLVRTVRQGGPVEEANCALERLARSQLDDRDAAVELRSLLTPIVAVAAYVTFVALALHRYPQSRPRTKAERSAFIQEVRRFYPFLPPLTAEVRRDFEWRGMTFPKGRRVLLDIHGTNRHPDAWFAPDEFRPERFANVSPSLHLPRGEQLTLTLLDEALLQLLVFMQYSLPDSQDLRLDLHRGPALPHSRVVLEQVRARSIPPRPSGEPHDGSFIRRTLASGIVGRKLG